MQQTPRIGDTEDMSLNINIIISNNARRFRSIWAQNAMSNSTETLS